ncbi:hypothetical protein SEUCBS139899_002461 [Sporothrix eucalyptigena]|uniref:AA1-like domain-containing protein n=1 Tax=Sporothrix eucalyptigena TaxID=1812306 RepID=A0ABP0B500_9PEZI
MRSSTLFGLAAAAASSVSALPHTPVVVRDDNPGCTADSFGDFDWTISDFVYNTSIVFSTPAHQIPNGVVQFNLTNPALTYTAVCEAYSTQLSGFFYGNIVYTCTEPSNETTTTFTFNAGTSELNVNQTWTCSDEDAEYPDTFTYAGAVNLTLDCTADSYQNPNWTLGEIYSSNTTYCSQDDIIITPYLATAVA